MAKGVTAFSNVWIVVAESAPADEFVVHPKEVVFKQRVLPTGAAQIQSDYEGIDGKNAAQSGAQLIELRAEGKAIFCSTDMGHDFEYNNTWIGRKNRVRCFSDDDLDGDFDQSFWGYNSVKELPTLVGIIPDKLEQAVSIPYSRINPNDFKQKYFVAVFFTGKSFIRGNLEFDIRYGEDGRWGYFNSPKISPGQIKSYPDIMTIMGSIISAKRADESSVRVKVLRMMPAQPFGITVMKFTYFM
ncbi:hypothetical protein [Sphingobium fluviale]|uniref:Uncharacterized protein n=1 Tax=Sphingobium fluviale TaxID=2506423 RepID=A0A4Q1KI54_9SPHN|nr:hypothetical protein [Sphingobium fluviale]RXR28224.1 hypothetical protein EQG66_10725 [Sphingobium fluviale]